MAFGQHDAKFIQQATQGIGLHDAHLHHLDVHAVQGQASLLLADTQLLDRLV